MIGGTRGMVATSVLFGAIMLLLYWPMSRLTSMVWPYLLEDLTAFVCRSDTTLYAHAYSEIAFRLLPAGSSKADVLGRLGAPLNVSTGDGGEEVWQYTRSSCSSDYHCRVIHLRKGIVERKHSEYYLD